MVAEKRTIEKAIKVFESGGVEKIDNNSFQVKSINSERSHDVVENKCNCLGFKLYKHGDKKADRTCYHLEAVKLFKDSQGIS
ncbi:MAG: hypothetical protein HOD60_12515 [Candidatus Nitrosopelagicus sp.]|jgi:hypothetical protein|nr:hypothetical protein [Candidatus Nitrosopelagicus sp.]